MRRLVCLVGLIVLGIAAPAHAWQPPPVTAEARLAAFLPIARAAWPDSPCAGRETIRLHATLGTYDYTPTYGYEDYHPVADTFPADCLVEVTDNAYPGSAMMWCSMLTHELGHLAGLGHNDDPTSIMYGGTLVPWPPCNAAIPPPRGLAGARYVVREMLPGNGGRWRVICTSLRQSHPRCRAERRGLRAHRYAMLIVAGDVVSADPY